MTIYAELEREYALPEARFNLTTARTELHNACLREFKAIQADDTVAFLAWKASVKAWQASVSVWENTVKAHEGPSCAAA